MINVNEKNNILQSILIKSYFILLISVISTPSFGQNKKIDSLLTLLKKDKEVCPTPCPGDTNRVIHLYKLSSEYFRIGAYDSSIAFSNTALKISQQLNPPYKKGITNAYNNLGTINREQGNYSLALDFYLKALKINEELKDKNGIAKQLGNIAVVYHIQGDYHKALDYFLSSIKIGEELGDKKGLAVRYGNIGIVYKDQGNYPKALGYYLKAMKIDEELGNKKRLLNNKNV